MIKAHDLNKQKISKQFSSVVAKQNIKKIK